MRFIRAMQCLFFGHRELVKESMGTVWGVQRSCTRCGSIFYSRGPAFDEEKR